MPPLAKQVNRAAGPALPSKKRVAVSGRGTTREGGEGRGRERERAGGSNQNGTADFPRKKELGGKGKAIVDYNP